MSAVLADVSLLTRPISAYAAYISGILINVVGFAGASESFRDAFSSELSVLSLLFLSWSNGTDCCHPYLSNELLYWLWGFSPDLLAPQCGIPRVWGA